MYLDMSQQRDEDGQFTETVTDGELLAVFAQADDPVLSAPEVAQRLQEFGIRITPEAVQYRLDGLAEAGVVDRKQIGARAVAWWVETPPEATALLQDVAEELTE